MAQATPPSANASTQASAGVVVIKGTASAAEDGSPLEFISVMVKGTNDYAVTDAEGRYTIATSRATGTLVFNLAGYTSLEEPIANRSIVNISLSPETSTLEDALVTGYQTLPKERTTGAFVKVSSQKLSTHRLSTLSTLLDGQVAGYFNGYIRGLSTMSGSKTPLYVIDGFPVENTTIDAYGVVTENLPEMNLEDIESITVLKDAAATSIYGARAANGVVVITMKKAKQGKVQVGFSSTFTWRPYDYYTDYLTNSADIISLEKQWAAENPELNNGLARAQAEANNRRNGYAWPSQGVNTLLDLYTGVISQAEADVKLTDLASRGYAYYDDAAKYAGRDLFIQQYNISLAKASEQNSITASVSYRSNKEERAYEKNNQLGINVANSLKVAKWITLDLGGFISYKGGTTPTYSLYSKPSAGFTFSPYDRLVDEQGNHLTMPSQVRKTVRDNIATYGLYDINITPLDELNRRLTELDNFSCRALGKLDIKPFSWLSYNAMFQYEYGVTRHKRLEEMESYATRTIINNFATQTEGKVTYNLPAGDIFYSQNNFSNAYNFRQQLNFNETIGDAHELTFMLGSEVRNMHQEYNDQTYYGYDPDMLGYQYLNQPLLTSGFIGLMNSYAVLTDAQLSKNSEFLNRFVSMYANATYAYKQRYAFTGSVRWDRSNLWGTGFEYQNKPFWSVGASWNLNRENFFKASWIDMLKLRASYGIGGNIAKDASPYLTAAYKTSTLVGGISGSVDLPPNPTLRWEETETTNIGVDFVMFRNRLSGSVDFYNKNSEDLLANQMGIATEGFGYSTLKFNNGAMINRGLEFALQGDVIQRRSFRWNAALLFAYNHNEVTKINVKAPVYVLQMAYPESYPVVGNSYTGIYAYKWAGLSGEGDPQIYDENGNITTTGYQSLDQISYVGTTMPPYSGSFTNTLSYKNLDFSVMLIYAAGHKIKNSAISAINMSMVDITASNIRYRWQQAGDELLTNIPRVRFSGTPGYYTSRETIYSGADIHVLDASNIRISNISLAYHLPAAWCGKMCLSNARVQLNVENLAFFTTSKEAKYSLGGYVKPNYVCGLYMNF